MCDILSRYAHIDLADKQLCHIATASTREKFTGTRCLDVTIWWSTDLLCCPMSTDIVYEEEVSLLRQSVCRSAEKEIAEDDERKIPGPGSSIDSSASGCAAPPSLAQSSFRFYHQGAKVVLFPCNHKEKSSFFSPCPFVSTATLVN